MSESKREIFKIIIIELFVINLLLLAIVNSTYRYVPQTHILTTCEDFQSIGNGKDFPNASHGDAWGLDENYELQSNLDCSNISNFQMLAVDETFTGTIDGKGYTINGISTSSTEDVAIFNHLGNKAEISNLNFTGLNINSSTGAASLALENEAKLNNVMIEGNLTSDITYGLSKNIKKTEIDNLELVINMNGTTSSYGLSYSVSDSQLNRLNIESNINGSTTYGLAKEVDGVDITNYILNEQHLSENASLPFYETGKNVSLSQGVVANTYNSISNYSIIGDSEPTIKNTVFTISNNFNDEAKKNLENVFIYPLSYKQTSKDYTIIDETMYTDRSFWEDTMKFDPNIWDYSIGVITQNNMPIFYEGE